MPIPSAARWFKGAALAPVCALPCPAAEPGRTLAAAEQAWLWPAGAVVVLAVGACAWALAQARRLRRDLRAARERLADAKARLDGCDAVRREMQRRQDMMSTVLDAIPVGISWVEIDRPETRVVNAAHARLSGVTDEATRLGRESYLRASHPEDYAAQSRLMERLLKGEIPAFDLEKRYLHADGRVVWVHFACRRMRDPSTGATVEIGTIVDITARKQAEAELRHKEAELRFVFDNLPVGVSLRTLFADGREACQFNPEHLRIVGFRSDELADPNDILLLTHPEDMDRQMALRERMRSGAISSYALEKRYVTRDGRVVWVDFHAMRRNYENGTSQYLTTVTDITARKRHENELETARAEAVAANHAKSLFLAMMSHEIRTPMNGVVGMASLLLDTPLSEAQRDYVETIRTSGEALLAVINDILDFSRIESGRLELEREPFALRECVEGVIDIVAARASEKQLDLLYEVDPAVPVAVEGDGNRLRQILVNLLGNAVKFTERGEVVLSVKASPPGASGLSELSFSVSDTGIGIAPEAAQRLFQSFSQVDASTTRKYGGTGLGLAISRRLVELMGGTMGMKSEVGRGSTFFFTIPARETKPPQASSALAEQNFAGRRLLLVDDNPTNLRILAAQLAGWGVCSEACASAEEAMELLRRDHAFDAAILDLHMPGEDGVALAARMRAGEAALARVPRILLSSLCHQQLGGDRELFAAVLTKPAKPAQLQAALRRAFGSGRPAETDGRANAAPPAAAVSKRAARVLLVEDNAVNQKVISLMLARLGYEVTLAGNGLEGLRVLRDSFHPIVLLDVQMPVMDGLSAAAEIRRLWPEEDRRPWVIALTANAMQGDREQCLRAGMDDYLAKPLRAEALSAAMEGAETVLRARAASAG